MKEIKADKQEINRTEPRAYADGIPVYCAHDAIVPVAELKPNPNNPNRHPPEQIRKLGGVILANGWRQPITVSVRSGMIVKGHGRLLAAELEELKEAPVDWQNYDSAAAEMADLWADNYIAELAETDRRLAADLLAGIQTAGAPLELAGSSREEYDAIVKALASGDPDFGANMAEGKERQVSNEEYEAFVEKFDLPKTTDDCFTPPEVYAAVLEWATKEYGLEGRPIVRPFYPGGDYENYDYPAGCVVLDNPPFSILSQIVRFYQGRKTDFFLFAPGLTLFAGAEAKYIGAGCEIEYENGAKVDTGFVTSLGGPLLRTAPDLCKAVKTAQETVKKEKAVELPKYKYPAHLITSAALGNLSKRGQEWSTNFGYFTRKLDTQEGGIYGGGYLVGDKAAGEAEAARREAEAARREAEAARAVDYALSEREQAIVAELTKKEKGRENR